MKKSQERTYQNTEELQNELDSLNKLISKLSIRAVTVKKKLKNCKKTQETIGEKKRSIDLGDRVIVRSRYKGRFGSIGIITKISELYGWVKINSTTGNKTIQVRLSNLEHYRG